MRKVGKVLGLVLLLAACGQPAGPVSTSSMPAQLVDDADRIPVAAPVNPVPPVGALFLGGRNLHTCTGSVVHSNAGDLILSAAHCFVKGVTTTFVPGFADSADPSNIWTVDAVYLDPLWVVGKDPRVDYAFARVSRPAGGLIEAVVGSALLLGTAPPRGSQVSIIGYAAGVGGTPIGCTTSTGITLSGYPSFLCRGLVDGTSGAPWMIGSTVTGVTGGLQRGGCTSWVSYSAPFNTRTAALLARADAGGRSDAAPIAFLGC
jgi:Trypsin-like peptidase domain